MKPNNNPTAKNSSSTTSANTQITGQRRSREETGSEPEDLTRRVRPRIEARMTFDQLAQGLQMFLDPITNEFCGDAEEFGPMSGIFYLNVGGNDLERKQAVKRIYNYATLFNSELNNMETFSVTHPFATISNVVSREDVKRCPFTRIKYENDDLKSAKLFRDVFILAARREISTRPQDFINVDQRLIELEDGKILQQGLRGRYVQETVTGERVITQKTFNPEIPEDILDRFIARNFSDLTEYQLEHLVELGISRDVLRELAISIRNPNLTSSCSSSSSNYDNSSVSPLLPHYTSSTAAANAIVTSSEQDRTEANQIILATVESLVNIGSYSYRGALAKALSDASMQDEEKQLIQAKVDSLVDSGNDSYREALHKVLNGGLNNQNRETVRLSL